MNRRDSHSRVGLILDSWRNGATPDTRAALQAHPELGCSESVFMSLALAEYRMRLNAGEEVGTTRFCAQFSTYRDELRRMLSVERGLTDLGVLTRWPEPNDEFLEFDLQAVLGKGAAAQVYLASQTTIGHRPVALKVTPFDGGEAHTLGKLQHPNVVPVLSVHYDPDRQLTAVCMPYLGSATLHDVIRRAWGAEDPPRAAEVILKAAQPEGIFELGVAVEPYGADRFPRGAYVEGVAWLAAELASGLAYTHDQGILHHDLKPSNVLITPAGRPMLLDFNLAWDPQRARVRLGGTLPYMAPEQLHASFLAEAPANPSTDPRSDLFSLGVILFELLTGRLPFPCQGPDLPATVNNLALAHLRGAPPLRTINPRIPARLARWVDACLRLEIAARPKNARQLAEALRPAARAWPAAVRSWALRGVAATAVVGAAALFAWRSGPDDGPPRPDPTRLVAQQSTPADPLDFGRRKMHEGDFGMAAHYLRQAHQRQPDAATKAELAYCYFRLDEISSATVWLQRTLAQAPGNADVWSNLGYCHLRLGDYRSAIECLDKALVLDPSHVLALHNRAACNLLVSQDLAEQDFGVSRIHRALAGVTRPHFALHATAARLHALALAEGRLEPATAENQIRQHLAEAINLGYPARQLRAARQFQPVASEPWFEELAARARNSTATPELWTAHYQAPRPSSTTAQLALR